MLNAIRINDERFDMEQNTLAELAEIVIRQQQEIEALRWTNTTLIKTEKKKRRKLWNKAVNQFAEKLRNGHSIESIIEEMTT